jgi:hypothetical protein
MVASLANYSRPIVRLTGEGLAPALASSLKTVPGKTVPPRRRKLKVRSTRRPSNLKKKQGNYSIYETTAEAFKTWGGYQALVPKEPVFEKESKSSWTTHSS